MIYEIALLPVHKEQTAAFRRAFAEVEPLLKRAKGYGGHLLAQGIETPEVFNLIVRWQSLEDHTPGLKRVRTTGCSCWVWRSIFRTSRRFITLREALFSSRSTSSGK